MIMAVEDNQKNWTSFLKNMKKIKFRTGLINALKNVNDHNLLLLDASGHLGIGLI